MNPSDLPRVPGAAEHGSCLSQTEALSLLVAAPRQRSSTFDPGVEPIHGVVVGELLALTVENSQPLVSFPGQSDTAAQVARSSVDLHGAHIGHPVVLVFERGDPRRPIVIGVLNGPGWPIPEGLAQV